MDKIGQFRISEFLAVEMLVYSHSVLVVIPHKFKLIAGHMVNRPIFLR